MQFLETCESSIDQIITRHLSLSSQRAENVHMPLPVASFFRWPLAAVLALGLVACQATPEPPAGIGQSPTAPQNSAALLSTSTSETTFAFEPFTGAPGNIADDLSRYIGEEAQKQGLTLVRRVGATATYRVKGYLSATGEPSSATVFYVFDVVNPRGTRLARISGTETVSGTKGDPWEAIDSSSLQRIANRSVVEIAAWLNRQ